jgi:hypothetical protein
VKSSAQRSIPATLVRTLVTVALLTALTQWAAAQRSGHAAASRPASPHLNKPTGNFGQSAHPAAFRRSSPRASLPFPFFGDLFNPDDIYSTGYPVASQPPAFLLQAVRNLAGSSDSLAQPANTRQPSSTQPLIIELQNGRYVRIAGTPANGEVLPAQLTSNDAQSRKATSHRSDIAPAIASPALDLPSAVLIFRDGHTEEVRDYTIADGILYARGDYYTDGYWNKNVAISTLDIAKTLQANTTRQVKFILPTSPNEVITRP